MDEALRVISPSYWMYAPSSAAARRQLSELFPLFDGDDERALQ